MKKFFLFALLFTAAVSHAVVKTVPAQYSTIQAAINASANGDTVLVSPGTFFENINFRGKKIVLTSEYYVTQNTASIYATVINGSTPSQPDSGSCVIINNGEDSTTVLQGFAITGGTGTKWNDEHSAGLYREGGGILVQYSSPVIKDNIIYNNVINNVTGVNSTGGGGIRIGDSYVRFYNNIVMNNSARYGAGIVLNYCGGEYKNNIVCSNYGSYQYGAGSGFWLNGHFTRATIIENNTVAGNSATASISGIFGNGAVAATIQNNIIWGNTSPNLTQITGSGFTLRYNDIQGGPSFSGNINVNPQFRDSNYVLTPGSPCIDKGDSSSQYNDLEDPNNTGFAKYPSLGGLRNDIGAYGGSFARILTGQLIGVNDPSVNIPSDFRLFQNYPNPFNPVTKISFELPAQGNVEVRVYDASGRETALLFSGVKSSGRHELLFDASKLSSGVYFYTMKTDKILLTRKMVLIK